MDGHTLYRVTVTMEGVRVGDLVWVPDGVEWAAPLIASGFLFNDNASPTVDPVDPVDPPAVEPVALPAVDVDAATLTDDSD